MGKNRVLQRVACVCVLAGSLVPWGERALAAPGDVSKLKAVLISFDQAGKSIVYEREHAQKSARVSQDALPKLAAMKAGQVVELRLQEQYDEWPLVLDAKKSRSKIDYLLFVLGGLAVLFVPAG